MSTATASSRAGRSRPLAVVRIPTRLRRAMLLAPVVALLGVFFGWPILAVLLRSLDPDGTVTWSSPRISTEHYVTVLTDPTLRDVIVHTVVVAIWATAVTAALAFPVAYLISRLSRQIAVTLLTLILLQFWISILVRLFAYTQVLGREGFINSLAETFGLGPYDLLFNTTATVIGMVVYLLPYMILILYAGMSGIDLSLVTAAKTLGASPRQAFWRIYVPLVRPSFVTGTLLIFVLSLGFFLTPAVLGGPGDTTVSIYIQQQIGLYQWGVASAIGILLLVVTLVLYVGAVRAGGMASALPGGGRAGKGTANREPLRIGAASVLLWLVTLAVLLLLLLPLLVVVPVSFTDTSRLVWPPEGTTTRWYEKVLESPIWLDAMRKSALVATGTAIVATGAGLLLARTMFTLRSAFARSLLLTLVYAPLVVPIILLAIGIYDVETRLGLLGSNVGLTLAHAVLAIPFAFAILHSALSGIDPSVEHAAWTLGASRRRAFWSTVMPNVIPSLVSALLISFITSWDEPVVALFQTGLKKTLPVTIFTQLKSGVTPALAAVATMLVGLVLLCLLIGLLWSARRTRSTSVKAG